jgi:type IV secretion system protein VirB10
MKVILSVFLLCGVVFAQPGSAPAKGAAGQTAESSASQKELVIPSGTRVPVALKNAISTKSARDGDSVYAETTFPLVMNDRVLIPAGTYVQGRIAHVKRAGRVKGRAEVLIHFTTLIYPSGYTVILPGSIENVPGAESTKMKDQEGTIQENGQTGQKLGTVAGTAASGTLIGAVAGGGKGALVGAGLGGAVGSAIALLTRGTDVRLDSGTTVEMVIQRPVTLDASRVPSNTGNTVQVSTPR